MNAPEDRTSAMGAPRRRGLAAGCWLLAAEALLTRQDAAATAESADSAVAGSHNRILVRQPCGCEDLRMGFWYNSRHEREYAFAEGAVVWRSPMTARPDIALTAACLVGLGATLLALQDGGRWTVDGGDVKIDGWSYLGKDICPEPGLVVGHPADDGPGHVGIVDFDGEGIAAGGTEVNRRYRLFLDGTSGFNKYTGSQGGEEDE